MGSASVLVVPATIRNSAPFQSNKIMFRYWDDKADGLRRMNPTLEPILWVIWFEILFLFLACGTKIIIFPSSAQLRLSYIITVSQPTNQPAVRVSRLAGIDKIQAPAFFLVTKFCHELDTAQPQLVLNYSQFCDYFTTALTQLRTFPKFWQSLICKASQRRHISG